MNHNKFSFTNITIQLFNTCKCTFCLQGFFATIGILLFVTLSTAGYTFNTFSCKLSPCFSVYHIDAGSRVNEKVELYTTNCQRCSAGHLVVNVKCMVLLVTPARFILTHQVHSFCLAHSSIMIRLSTFSTFLPSRWAIRIAAKISIPPIPQHL